MASLLDQLGLTLPEGYGFHPASCRTFPDDLYDRLLIWEKPRPDQLYVLSADIGDGIGQDRSVADVTRVGTLQEPDEQVAQFVSDSVDPIGFAPILDAVGRLYRGKDNLEAVCAIECNNHGLVTQSELQLHLGYSNLFVWQYVDAADPERALSQRIGWWTTQRTRPMILVRYLRKLAADDPVTNLPDYRINSPLTMEELRSFQTELGIREAEADPKNPNAHDDCIMAGAIGVQVSSTLQYETNEPTDQARRRMNEEKNRRLTLDKNKAEGRDYINQEFTAEEAGGSDALRVEDYDDSEGSWY